MCSTMHQSSPPLAVAVAGADKDDDGDWRQEAINGGSLKLVHLETGSNGWTSPPSDLFSLRGRNFFTKKNKSPSGPWLLHPAGVDWLRSASKLDHVLSRADNRVMHTLRKKQSPSGPWIVKATVGNYSAYLLGEALNCHYHGGYDRYGIKKTQME
ncbi:hypothetical protein SSX86_033182 [Deinandra increscens subsp. villosa]|uniref:Protein ENHANCED DISEASE RESISTANCE 2 C-terminal domain-containing protein n=1 Tax=Deinandra increscens subsp. villosa TaxID=3103831 RepID=A0AAP0C327_9ASTR